MYAIRSYYVLFQLRNKPPIGGLFFLRIYRPLNRFSIHGTDRKAPGLPGLAKPEPKLNFEVRHTPAVGLIVENDFD